MGLFIRLQISIFLKLVTQVMAMELRERGASSKKIGSPLSQHVSESSDDIRCMVSACARSEQLLHCASFVGTPHTCISFV